MTSVAIFNLSPKPVTQAARPVDNRVTGDRLGDRYTPQPVTRLNRIITPFSIQKVTGDRFISESKYLYVKSGISGTKPSSMLLVAKRLKPTCHLSPAHPNSGRCPYA